MRTHQADSSHTGISHSTIDLDRTSRTRSWSDGLLAPPGPELLSACRAGDQDAWELLTERYERLVFSVALRHGVTREEAAGITEMTFAVLLESITRLRDEERLASWLMCVARRLSSRPRERLSIDELSWAGDPPAGWDRVAVVHEALQRLGRSCRELLLALYFDPAAPSHAEVAGRLGRTAGGIGPMRARCLRHLRALLGEDAPPLRPNPGVPSFETLLDWLEDRLTPAAAARVAAHVQGADECTRRTVGWLRGFLATAQSFPLHEPPPIVRQNLSQYFTRWSRGQAGPGWPASD